MKSKIFSFFYLLSGSSIAYGKNTGLSYKFPLPPTYYLLPTTYYLLIIYDI
ncbi:MAG: hypothetical protein JSV88_29110 [Candidatus Aminicenantes bacterium]|nr:MAG: hypothetical protein JSV88_29110 [Candidatus Aminicenantes bacterium]